MEVTGAAGKLTAVSFVRLVRTVVAIIADFVARDTFVVIATLEVCAATFERTGISDALERRVCTRTGQNTQTYRQSYDATASDQINCAVTN